MLYLYTASSLYSFRLLVLHTHNEESITNKAKPKFSSLRSSAAALVVPSRCLHPMPPPVQHRHVLRSLLPTLHSHSPSVRNASAASPLNVVLRPRRRGTGPHSSAIGSDIEQHVRMSLFSRSRLRPCVFAERPEVIKTVVPAS